jgi:uncharacterized protein YjbI with pentapeptide repeats
LREAQGSRAVLARADLRDANLRDAIFDRANFEGSLFTMHERELPPSMWGVNLEGSTYDYKTQLPFNEDRAKTQFGMRKV